ncbi:MAG TPA: polymer-forming cytoskeletal protein [Candidatus Acidoferrum sp.]|nr:polymer-forming cytoskeletal protein [Candidatus Acidoferrum sp.]
MWHKPDESKPKSTSAASTSPVAPAHPSGTAPQNPPNTPAAVGHNIKIKGEISGHGDFFLDGEFEGLIRLTGGTFTVGSNARVSAEIEAREVVIRGEVIGSLKSCERVHIWSTGKLTGDMETRGIVIEDGAVLHSKVATPQAKAAEAAEPEPAAPETTAAAEPTVSKETRAKTAGA